MVAAAVMVVNRPYRRGNARRKEDSESRGDSGDFRAFTCAIRNIDDEVISCDTLICKEVLKRIVALFIPAVAQNDRVQGVTASIIGPPSRSASQAAIIGIPLGIRIPNGSPRGGGTTATIRHHHWHHHWHHHHNTSTLARPVWSACWRCRGNGVGLRYHHGQVLGAPVGGI